MGSVITKQSQNKKVLIHLIDQGSITSLEALDLYGIFRLAARVYVLRKEGHVISSTPFITGSGKTVAKYFYHNIQRQ